MKYEARTSDGRKIGGYTTNTRDGKNYRELKSDIQWKRGY